MHHIPIVFNRRSLATPTRCNHVFFRRPSVHSGPMLLSAAIVFCSTSFLLSAVAWLPPCRFVFFSSTCSLTLAFFQLMSHLNSAVFRSDPFFENNRFFCSCSVRYRLTHKAPSSINYYSFNLLSGTSICFAYFHDSSALSFFFVDSCLALFSFLLYSSSSLNWSRGGRLSLYLHWV